LNSVVHRSYETGNPIQIKIFDDKVFIFNDARLPVGITEEDLQLAHKSMQYNPLKRSVDYKKGTPPIETCRHNRRQSALDVRRDVLLYLHIPRNIADTTAKDGVLDITGIPDGSALDFSKSGRR